jgi:pyruvate formate lyase activating enzyme
MTDVPRTPMETLIKIYDVAKELGVLFPYLGNVSPGEYENTKCSKCGNVCIERVGFSINLDGIVEGKCKKCGSALSIII